MATHRRAHGLAHGGAAGSGAVFLWMGERVWEKGLGV